LRQPESRYWVLSAIRPLETTLSRSRQSRILGLLKGRQSCRRLCRNHWTSLYRLLLRRNLWRPEGRKWIIRAFPPLELSLYRIYQRRILRHPEGI
jgi:hypothetical protein